MSSALSTLNNVLTPELFSALNDHYFPFPLEEPLNGATVSEHTFGGSRLESFDKLYNLTFETALKPISQCFLEDLTGPVLLSYLPAPTDPKFPAQSLGLILLLDQAPRLLFSGTDSRYSGGFFDILASRLTGELFCLPLSQRPDSAQRWAEAGVSFEHSFLRRMYFYAPLAHSENLSDHLLGLGLIETFRRQVETHYGHADPTRRFDHDDISDPHAFWRLMTAGPPRCAQKTTFIFFFWMGRAYRQHFPIIAKFGRVPQSNYSRGREHTEPEVKFLEEEGITGPRDVEAAQRIKDDVVKGVWTPLVGKKA